MKKIETRYSNHEICIAVSEEIPNHISVYDGIEPCSGVLRHWGTKEKLISELKNIIKELENLKLTK